MHMKKKKVIGTVVGILLVVVLFVVILGIFINPDKETLHLEADQIESIKIEDFGEDKTYILSDESQMIELINALNEIEMKETHPYKKLIDSIRYNGYIGQNSSKRFYNIYCYSENGSVLYLIERIRYENPQKISYKDVSYNILEDGNISETISKLIGK